MKTHKILLKILVVLIIASAIVIPSTFSWYDHNGELTGNRMGYSRSGLPVSAGTVSVVTKKYRTENNKLWYDTKGNKEYTDTVSGSSSVSASSVQYYGTTFTNTGSAPAYVNLYLKDFTNSPTVKVGTLQPSLTHKNISSSVHLTNKNMIRVYFQVKETNDWSASGAKTYLVYKTKTNSTYQNKEITSSINNANDTGNILKGVATKYVDLADDTTEFYFATDGKKSGFNTSDCSVTQPWYRTQTITNVQAETGYYLTGVADDTTFNAQYGTFNIPGGISVKTYFNNMTINKNQHAYVTLNKGTNYTGASAAYILQSGSNISVNGNSGYVTAESGLSSGNNIATIRTTITGSLGDTTYVDTAVSNPSTQAVPVALNVEVPGKTTETVDGQTVTTNGTAEIVWYIDNSATSSAVSFNSVYYTK